MISTVAFKGLLRTGNVVSSSLLGKAEKRFSVAEQQVNSTEVFMTVGIYQRISIQE